MTNEELVKALRICSSELNCGDCPLLYRDSCSSDELMADAATAIEALQAELAGSKDAIRILKHNLEMKLPKRGEWQKAKPHGVVTYSDGYAECSHCHEAIWLGWGMNFCPNCGTQNKIIDPDDYDGAKMNDSNASNALGNAQDGPIITPCRGCSDYDGYGGCKSKGGCARAKMEVQDA